MPSDPQEDGSKANGRPLPFLFSLISWQTTFLLEFNGFTTIQTFSGSYEQIQETFIMWEQEREEGCLHDVLC